MSWLTGIVFFQMICEMFKGKLKLQLQNIFEQYRWVRLKIRPPKSPENDGSCLKELDCRAPTSGV